MSEEKPEDEGLKKALETRFEDLFLDDDIPAYTPDLDVEDEDVVDLGQDSGVFEAVGSGEHEESGEPYEYEEAGEVDGEVDPEESRGDPGFDVDPESLAGALGWDGESRFVKDSGRYSAIFSAAVGSPKSFPERVLIGLLLANVVLIGLMFLVPEVFQGEGDPPSKESTRRAEEPRPPTPDAGSRSTRDREPTPEDPSAMPDAVRYELAQEQIGKGNYEEASRQLEAYLAAHPDLPLIQRRAVFSGLLYRAQRSGNRARAAVLGTRVASLRRLSATPDELWTEVKEAAAAQDGPKMRQLYARMLLQQDRLATQWKGRGRIDAMRAGFADSYRHESEAASRKGVR